VRDRPREKSEGFGQLKTPVVLNLGICIPARNELENLYLLLEEVDAALDHPLVGEVSVIVFDDGSDDNTFGSLRDAQYDRFTLHVLRSLVSVGKSQALASAIREALSLEADAIVTLDGDYQDDPADIPHMIEKLLEGHDVVNGRRSNRAHPPLKRVSSRAFNAAVRAVTNISMWDINSGVKAYSRSAAHALLSYYYGELHRVILVVAVWVGLSVGEVRIVNRARKFGTTKYGVARSWRGIFDLLTIQFLRRYHSRPGHFFSGFGSVSILLGAIVLAISVGRGGANEAWIVDPLLALLSAILFGTGAIFLCLGFIAELVLFLSKGASVSVIRSLDSYPPPPPTNRTRRIVG